MALHVWITTNRMQSDAPEYRLAERMLRGELGCDGRLHRIEIDTETPENALHLALCAWLDESPSIPDDVLIIRDTWLVIAKGSIAALRDRLAETPDSDCMVPMQPGLLPTQWIPDYHTRSGFARFHRALLSAKVVDAPLPDHFRPHLFLVRGQILHSQLQRERLFDIPATLGERCGITSRAYVHPLPDYFASARADILPLIPCTTQSLLDIGCGTGALGKNAARLLGCRVVGIEQNAAVARLAESVLDRVLVGDVMQLDPGERFNCVTCLDLLEHLAEPRQLLARIADNYLAPGGCLILSVPNVGHWSLVVDLLAGRWDYVPAGLLCKTHLRFFTLHSLTELLADCGLAITRLDCIPAPPPSELRQQLSLLAKGGLEVDVESLNTIAFHIVGHLGA